RSRQDGRGARDPDHHSLGPDRTRIDRPDGEADRTRDEGAGRTARRVTARSSRLQAPRGAPVTMDPLAQRLRDAMKPLWDCGDLIADRLAAEARAHLGERREQRLPDGAFEAVFAEHQRDHEDGPGWPREGC